MDDEEWLSPQKAGENVTIGEDLSNLSIEQLKERLTLLDKEKQRVESEISQKEAHAKQASNLFK